MQLEKVTLIEVNSEGEYECRGEKYYAFGVMNTKTFDAMLEKNNSIMKDDEVVFTQYDLTDESSAKDFLESLMESIPKNEEDWLLEFIEEENEVAFKEMSEITDYVTKNFTRSSQVVLSMGDMSFKYTDI